MPTLNPAVRLATALEQARHHRHYAGCRCGMYRNAAGEAFCTREEANWSTMVDRLLTTVCQEASNNASTAIQH